MSHKDDADASITTCSQDLNTSAVCKSIIHIIYTKIQAILFCCNSFVEIQHVVYDQMLIFDMLQLIATFVGK